jgi:hypothetical protein
MRTDADSIACETHHLMCMVCGALPGTTCLDEDLRELELVHPSRRLTIAERNWRTRNAGNRWNSPGAALPVASRGHPWPRRRARRWRGGYVPDLDLHQVLSGLRGGGRRERQGK